MNIQNFLKTPWKIENEINRLIQYPFERILFIINRIKWGKNWKIYGLPIIQRHANSEIKIGYGANLRSSVRSNPLGPNHPIIICTWQAEAVINIGNNFGMTGGTLCAAKKIFIGNNVIVGANSTIIDTDFHPLNPTLRIIEPQMGLVDPILIEDNVFIGMNCIILKGVTIGQGSVIGAGSVVTCDVPSDVIAAGNPARVIKAIKPNEDHYR